MLCTVLFVERPWHSYVRHETEKDENERKSASPVAPGQLNCLSAKTQPSRPILLELTEGERKRLWMKRVRSHHRHQNVQLLKYEQLAQEGQQDTDCPPSRITLLSS